MTVFATILLLSVIYYAALAGFFLFMSIKFAVIEPTNLTDSVASAIVVIGLVAFMMWIDIQQLSEILQ